METRTNNDGTGFRASKLMEGLRVALGANSISHLARMLRLPERTAHDLAVSTVAGIPTLQGIADALGMAGVSPLVAAGEIDDDKERVAYLRDILPAPQTEEWR